MLFVEKMEREMKDSSSDFATSFAYARIMLFGDAYR